MRINYLFIAFILMLLVTTGCKEQKATDKLIDNAIPAEIQKVQGTSVSKKIRVSGNIEGNKTVRLGFMVAGKVNYIATEEGQSVQAGELLASLDPENYSIAKDIADANLDQTQDEYNRLSQMYERKSISESDFIKISSALKVAKAQQRLQAKNLSDTRLFSPIGGVLLKKGTEVGEIVGTGMPLFAVSDIKTVKVNASVPESDLHFIRINDEATVYISSLDSTFTGKIIEIGSVAEAATRAFTVKIELINPNLLIKPGMTAEIQVNTFKTLQCITIPTESVLHDIDNSSYVYIADTTGNKAFKRKVSLGNIMGNNIEVISGLSEGESIVIGGQQKLSNGSSIILK